MMSKRPPAPSAAALLYLFADRVIEPDTALSKAFEVPCTQARVQQTWLAADVFAITFWHLAEQGKLDLAVGKRTLLGVGRPQITATLRPGVPIPQPKTTPLDPTQLGAMSGLPSGLGAMLEKLGPQMVSAQAAAAMSLQDAVTMRLGTMQPTPVRDLIRDWFGSDVSDPQRYVLDRVPPELTTLGFVVGATAGGMFSTPKPVVDCAKRAELEGTAQEMLDRWRAFRDNEQGLGPTLRDRCKAAIGSRHESDD
jgi:hypothetical protein